MIFLLSSYQMNHMVTYILAGIKIKDFNPGVRIFASGYLM